MSDIDDVFERVPLEAQGNFVKTANFVRKSVNACGMAITHSVGNWFKLARERIRVSVLKI